MIKKVLYILFISCVTFLSCKKQEKPNTNFTITSAVQSNNGSVLLQWNAVNLTGFKNISIYRSSSPIPDPAFGAQIDGNLQIAIITDNTVTSFIDSNLLFTGASGAVYYKAVINLNDRFIVSNQTQVNLNAFSVSLINNGGAFGSYLVKQLPEINALYVLDLNQNFLTYISYSKKSIITTLSFFSSTVNSVMFYPVINNNSPEVFIYTNNSISCYDGSTLNQKYSINISYTPTDFKVKNGFLYVIGNNTIYTYDLSTRNMVNQTNLPVSSFNSVSNFNIFTSGQSNLLYAKYYSQNQYYQSGIGYTYSYKNMVMAYNLVNGIPGTYSYLNIAAINGDTTNPSNINLTTYIQLSPDGKYLTCNNTGTIYSILDNTTHQVNSTSGFNPVPAYSEDGKYVLITNGNFSSTTPMNIYALPNFNIAAGLKSQNPVNSNVIVKSDFMDNDTLLSYNISSAITNNQVINTLTVLFKKID